ncbi:MAG: GumC family protein [Methylocystis sp.]|uniref:GumC family protein n=1 Tax=Methylocystis sp. TaxID=1911079 RepID=UPI003DA2C090
MRDANTDALLPATHSAPGSPADGDNGCRHGYGERIAPSFEATAENGFDYREHLRVILKRKKVIAVTTVGALSLGYLWSLLILPVYTATVRLQVDPEAKIVEKGDINAGDPRTYDYMKTQLELLQSRNMAERVAAIANFSGGAEQENSSSLSLSMLLGGKSKSHPPVAPSRNDLGVGRVLAGRVVKPIIGSRLVDISFTDPSPQLAEGVANAFGEAFINFNLDKRLESNAYAKTFLDEQIKQLKIRLQDAEKTMIDFAQKEKLIASTGRDSAEPTNFGQVSAALGAATAERIKTELQWKQVEAANAINLPQLLTNAAIAQLRSARGALTAEYQEKASTYGPGYPAMTEIKNKIAEIDRQLAAEVKTIKASYKAAYEASLAQEQELKREVEATRSETLDTQKRSIQFNILKREVDTSRALYESLLQRFKEVDVASGVGVNNVFVVDKAVLPSAPSYPVRSTFLRNALIAGLLAGIGLAYLLERLDDVIHSSDEAERLSRLTTLGIIPRVKNLEEEISDPRSGVSEAYRSLCTTLQLSTAEGLPKALLITSSMPGEGKSLTGQLIAKHFAAMGMRVLLIDADLRNASLHKKLGLDNSCGLSNFLTSGCTPTDAIQRVGDKHQFFFMSSGPLPPNSAELLGSQRLRYLIDITTRAFDLVIVDGPPVMGLADAPLLTRSVQATVFVVAANQTRKPALQSALKRLAVARTHLLGLVLTKFDAKSAGYGYGYGYGYGGAGYGQVGDDDKLASLENGNLQLEHAEFADDGDAVGAATEATGKQQKSRFSEMLEGLAKRFPSA